MFKNITPIPSSIVGLPDELASEINQAGDTSVHKIFSNEAQKGYILDNLKSVTLVSAGQLCDDGCKVILEKHDATIIKNDHVVLKGKRNRKDRLWDIKLPILFMQNVTQHYANAIIRKDTSKKELADYLYK